MGSSSYYHCGFANLQPHFLDSCSLCRRQLSQNRDIFMYRGNVPYCSQECRQEQIEIDEAIEKRRKLSSSSKRLNSVRQSKESSTSKESHTNNDVRTGTLVVA